ncbi:MAG: sigma 54-interacting transcriptional regulator [Acidobacteriota bacterium]
MTGRGDGAAPRSTLMHPALSVGEGTPLRHARLNDQQRVGVLLQGAAVLAHLDQTGGALANGWSGARLADDGWLRVGKVRTGRSEALPQEHMRDLLATLFGATEVAGRGRARRSARRLANRWRQTLLGVDPQHNVAAILDAAPFLWEDAHGVARRSLVGEHWRGDAWRVWVAGMAPDRRRVLCRDEDARVLAERLAGPQARRLWFGGESAEDPDRIAAAGRNEKAVRLWQLTPPKSARAALACARSLWNLGRFEAALDVVARRRGVDAVILRAACQSQLGQWGPAKITLGRLLDVELSSTQAVAAAEVAIRVHANRHETDEARDWVARCHAKARGPARWRAEVVAALAAWDRGAAEEMADRLEAATPLADDPVDGWRYFHARGLEALAQADGAGVVRGLARALGAFRRVLSRHRAGRLWNDLAIGRVLIGDLAGAERACRHSLRLLSACDGPVPITLALTNLAEVRIRRGRFEGVADIIARSAATNRRDGNRRGLARDLILATRFELAQGRAEAALARVREAADIADTDDLRAVLAVFAARALGWLGRRSEARARLHDVGDAAVAELEPEERPALWALADAPDEALAVAGDFEPLWRSLLDDRPPSDAAWQPAAELDAFRRARLVIDAALVAPRLVEPDRLSAAVVKLIGTGAEALANRVAHSGPWPAIGRFLARASTSRVEDDDAAAAGRLLAATGHGEARLAWRQHGETMHVAGGAGGSAERTAPVGDGAWVIAADEIDGALETLLALFARFLPPPRLAVTGAVHEPGIIGSSSDLLAALERVRKLAKVNVPVLVLGESGTGKELVARAVHRRSPRVEAPFLAVNCAALSETLILSDLFGHVRGAFTGADRDRRGVFEEARGGTVFLDEIGDLPAEAQGLLLRVLQEGEIRRVGESTPRTVDVRIVAATHRDLAAQVETGAFRQDLYFRLKVATVELPPLRERGDDLFALADHVLAGLRDPSTGDGPRLSTAARERLRSHNWPGNIRELVNVLEVAAALADDDRILPEHLDLPTVDSRPVVDYHRQVEEFRRRLVREALTGAKGKQAEAARRLGLSRQALSYLVRQLEIEI